MLLQTISLFLHYDLLSCLHYGKRNFSEDLLMKHHHQNFLQIKDFIKEAQHRFHEEKPLLGVRNDEHDTTRDKESLSYRNTTWWWDNSSFIDQLGLNNPRTFILPLIRSRPSFPFSITPYTTELNDRHLKWDEIFPDHNVGLRSGSEVTITLLNRSFLQSPSIPNPKDPNSSGPMVQPLMMNQSSRSLLFNTNLRHNISVRDHLGQVIGLTSAAITRNEDYMRWLREITIYTPVERWMQTLANKIGVTTSYGYTRNHTTKFSRTPFKNQTSIQNKQLKNDFKDQSHSILRQGPPISDVAAVDEHFRTATATTNAHFYTVNVSGIVHLRTVAENQDKTSMMVSGRRGTLTDNATAKVTPTTARDLLHGERDSETPGPSYRKSRRFRSKARKRKRYRHSQKRKRTRHSQKHSYRHPKFSDDNKRQKQVEEYSMLRRMRETTEGARRFSLNTQTLKRKKNQNSGVFFPNAVTRPTEKVNLRELTNHPTPMSLFLSELADSHDELLKLIETQDELRHKKAAEHDKVSVYNQLKESLEVPEKKEKENRLNEKAELIRKIVAGSSYSYSDEETILKKNLVEALRY